MTVMSYTKARANLASLCDQVVATREPVVIRRRNAHDVALISVDELAGLEETAHLLRSPENAHRLFSAMGRAQTGQLQPTSMSELRQELGLVEE